MDSLQSALMGLRLGSTVRVYDQVGSTNDAARELAEQGAAEGTLALAETQTAGRGRSGRRWITPPGSGLAFSLVLRPTLPLVQLPRLTMLAGLAACEGIERAAGVDSRLKWPNDVLVGGRKVAGILAESSLSGEHLDYVVLGIGVNVNASPPPEAVDFPATSLAEAAGHAVDRLSTLRGILGALEARYASLGSEALFLQAHHEWRARLALMDVPIAIHADGVVYPCRAMDVEPDGALVVRLESGEVRRWLAGEVRMRPV